VAAGARVSGILPSICVHHATIYPEQVWHPAHPLASAVLVV
jgi:hypothetical protein